MSGKTFYPLKISEFLIWGAHFVDQTEASATLLGIPQAETAQLRADWTGYAAAQAQAETPETRTSVIVEEAERRHEDIIKAIRRIKNGYVDPALTLDKLAPENYLMFGLSLPSTSHTSKGDPTDLIDYDISTLPSDHRVIVHYFIAGSTKHGKGDYHGAEVRFWIRALTEPAPQGPNDEGWHSEVDTASPWVWTAKDSADYGKRLYMTMRWENQSSGAANKTSGKGPWSAIQSVIIP
jgi:hypothetical protein